jgi:peptidoglycan/LPS O-acetylase OafA/YrhL
MAAPRVLGHLLPVADDYYHLDWLPWSLGFAVLIYGTMRLDGWARRLFECTALRFFGFISFSVYLFMDFIIAPIDKVVGRPVNYVGACIVAIVAVCYVSFVVIERPLSRLSLLRLARIKAVPATSRREASP